MTCEVGLRFPAKYLREDSSRLRRRTKITFNLTYGKKLVKISDLKYLYFLRHLLNCGPDLAPHHQEFQTPNGFRGVHEALGDSNDLNETNLKKQLNKLFKAIEFINNSSNKQIQT